MIKYIIIGISICKCICSYEVKIKHGRAVQKVLFEDIRGAKKGDTIVRNNAAWYFKSKKLSTDCGVEDYPDTLDLKDVIHTTH